MNISFTNLPLNDTGDSCAIGSDKDANGTGTLYVTNLFHEEYKI